MAHHHVDRSLSSPNAASRRRLQPLKASGIFGALAAPWHTTSGVPDRVFFTPCHPWPHVGLVGILVATLILAASTSGLTSPALGASPDVVISQIYPGASNTSALPYD